jgi:hypothetical protein
MGRNPPQAQRKLLGFAPLDYALGQKGELRRRACPVLPDRTQGPCPVRTRGACRDRSRGACPERSLGEPSRRASTVAPYRERSPNGSPRVSKGTKNKCCELRRTPGLPSSFLAGACLADLWRETFSWVMKTSYLAPFLIATRTRDVTPQLFQNQHDRIFYSQQNCTFLKKKRKVKNGRKPPVELPGDRYPLRCQSG